MKKRQSLDGSCWIEKCFKIAQCLNRKDSKLYKKFYDIYIYIYVCVCVCVCVRACACVRVRARTRDARKRYRWKNTANLFDVVKSNLTIVFK